MQSSKNEQPEKSGLKARLPIAEYYITASPESSDGQEGEARRTFQSIQFEEEHEQVFTGF